MRKHKKAFSYCQPGTKQGLQIGLTQTSIPK